jgi:hypothetical protein
MGKHFIPGWLTAGLILYTTIAATGQTISAPPVSTTSVCAGTSVNFTFSTTGTFPVGNAFKVRLLTAANILIQDLTETSLTSPIRATLPASLSAGSYRFQIAATSNSVLSGTNPITVAALPTLTLSGNTSLVAGSPASVLVSFTGTPPWSVTYADYKAGGAPDFYLSSTVTSANATVITPILFNSAPFDRTFIRAFADGRCGTSPLISGSATVVVTPLRLTAGPLSASYCPGSVVAVPFTTNGPLPTDAICQVQLSDATGNFQNGPIIGSSLATSPISATLPQNLNAGTGYRMQITLRPPTSPGTINYNDALVSVPAALTISRPTSPGVSDITFCIGTTVNALTATGTGLRWYADGGTQPLPAAPVPPNNQSSRYAVSQTVNGCESLRAVVNVTAAPTPSAPVDNSVSLCQGGQGQFSTAIPGARWYTAPTGGVGTAQPPTINNQVPGNQTYYVSQTINGCESNRTAVRVVVTPVPTSPAVQSAVAVCQFASPAPLSATGQSLTWYGQSGKLPSAPVPPTVSSGVLSYSVSQTVDGCESPLAALSVLVRPAPVFPTAQSVRYCVGDVPRSLTASGSGIRWYTTGTGGTAATSSPAFFTEQPDVKTFYVTQTDNNGCESQRLPVSVSVVAPPASPGVNPTQLLCQFARAVPLTATPNSGLIWQESGITGTSETAPTPVTTNPGSFTYAVSQRVGSCTSPPAVIVLTISRQPDRPSVTTPVNLCLGQTSTPLTAVAAGQLSWYTAPDKTGPKLQTVVPNTAQVSQTTYYVSQTDGFRCESEVTLIDVRVSPQATARLTGDGFINPGDSTAIRVRLGGASPWQFTDWTNARITTTDSLYLRWEKRTVPGAYTFAIRDLAGSCGAGNILNTYTLTVRAPLALQPQPARIALTVYPNPTTDALTIDWGEPITQPITLQLVSLDGRVVQHIIQETVSPAHTKQLQLQNQPAGVYLIRLQTSTQTLSSALVIKY